MKKAWLYAIVLMLLLVGAVAFEIEIKEKNVKGENNEVKYAIYENINYPAINCQMKTNSLEGIDWKSCYKSNEVYKRYEPKTYYTKVDKKLNDEEIKTKIKQEHKK